jgi:hypothetical protein
MLYRPVHKSVCAGTLSLRPGLRESDDAVHDGEQEQGRVQDEGNVTQRQAVAQATAHPVAQVQVARCR